ncbi:MinD/ParA family ATP-binding protein [Litorimonas sp. WD9-15]|uniref:MinD/ParA family ATP-binding protein n=1 Tax=Litorimonas sp. WD9-15 TaxID=3418716 RepID=UPI003D00E4C5
MASPTQKRVQTKSGGYEPACRLISLLSASGDAQTVRRLAIQLGRKAASSGETVLILDAVNGQLLQQAGIVHARTLTDVAQGKAQLRDALYVTSNEHFTAGAVGTQSLEDALGLLAALSLSYDWVFVVPEAGCTPAHVRLAAASDVALMSYDTQSDGFMRAFWMLDAVRARAPKFDPLTLSVGEKCDAVETALMLSDTVREHLGAPPPYAGHSDDLHIETRLLTQMRDCADRAAVA